MHSDARAGPLPDRRALVHYREMSSTTRCDEQNGLRRLAVAAIVGAAVVVWPAWPGPRRDLGYRPPPYARALRWADIIRLRLSPWLLDRTSNDED